MQYRFPIILFACLGCLGFSPSNQANFEKEVNLLSSSVSLLNTGALAQTPPTTTATYNYDDYMEAGSTAMENGDYPSALENFQKALELVPDDPTAQQRITQVKSFAYDNYMQAGYAATRQREYEEALRQFEQAKLLRPDNFYVQQAINNVNNYLVRDAQPEIEEKVEEEQEKPENKNQQASLFWLVLALAIALLLLFTIFLILGRGKAEQEETEEELPQKAEEIQSELKKVSEESKEINQSVVNSLPVEKTTRITNIDIINELISDLREPDPKKRKKAIWELARQGDSRAVKPLIEVMLASDSQERSLILEALSQISTRTIKPMNQALALSLQDDNAQVRKNAIRDVSKIYDLMSQIRQLLAHSANNDPDREVRETAHWAMEKLNLIQMPAEVEQLPRSQYKSKELENYEEDSH